MAARLAPWEVPRRDPPATANAPEVAAQRRAARQRWRERKREREAAHVAAEAHPPRSACTQLSS
jgi:hypothetical protein